MASSSEPNDDYVNGSGYVNDKKKLPNNEHELIRTLFAVNAARDSKTKSNHEEENESKLNSGLIFFNSLMLRHIFLFSHFNSVKPLETVKKVLTSETKYFERHNNLPFNKFMEENVIFL